MTRFAAILILGLGLQACASSPKQLAPRYASLDCTALDGMMQAERSDLNKDRAVGLASIGLFFIDETAADIANTGALYSEWDHEDRIDAMKIVKTDKSCPA